MKYEYFNTKDQKEINNIKKVQDMALEKGQMNFGDSADIKKNPKKITGMKKNIGNSMFENLKNVMDDAEIINDYYESNPQAQYIFDQLADCIDIIDNASDEKFKEKRKPEVYFAEQRIKEIIEEMKEIKDENISKESFGEIVERYLKIKDNYDTLKQILYKKPEEGLILPSSNN